MAPAPRIAIVGTTALATAAGTKIGLELGKALMENKEIENTIDANNLDAIKTGVASGRNSPSKFDSGFIHSVLEESEIPLITMVNGLCFLNYIEFSFILALFSLLFRKYLGIRLNKLILDLKNKNKSIKKSPIHPRLLPEGKDYTIPKEGVECSPALAVAPRKSLNVETLSLNKAFNIVDKYTDYLIVFIFICLIWIKFINIYFSSYLAENIDSFVKVYNHIKKQ
jgi:hypothetical protein